MTYSPVRAPARTFAVHLGAITTILFASAAAAPSPVIPYADDVAALGAELTEQVGHDEQRLVIPVNLELDFEPVVISVESQGVRGQEWPGEIPASIEGNRLLEEAAKYVGVPYRWGGKTPAGFDCSGFVAYVYGRLGVDLPAGTSALWGVGERVSRAEAMPGDLVMTPGHVGIYAGGDLVVEAPNGGSVVKFRTMWQRDPVFIRVADPSIWVY